MSASQTRHLLSWDNGKGTQEPADEFEVLAERFRRLRLHRDIKAMTAEITAEKEASK